MKPPSRPPLKPHWLEILLALAGGDLHGLEVMREVREATGGSLVLWPGKLYGSLRELSGLGWVEETSAPAHDDRGGNPRFYRLTGAGRGRLQVELSAMERVLERARERRLLDAEGLPAGTSARQGRGTSRS